LRAATACALSASGGDEAPIFGHGVDHRQLAAVLDGDVELAGVLARLVPPATVVDVGQLEQPARPGREPDDAVVAHHRAVLVGGLDGAVRPLHQLGMQRRLDPEGLAQLLGQRLRRRLVAAGAHRHQLLSAVDDLPLDREQRADLERARLERARPPGRQLLLQRLGLRRGEARHHHVIGHAPRPAVEHAHRPAGAAAHLGAALAVGQQARAGAADGHRRAMVEHAHRHDGQPVARPRELRRVDHPQLVGAAQLVGARRHHHRRQQQHRRQRPGHARSSVLAM
jgi:hypothetical protein